MKYISFSSVYMLSWYFSWFVHSAWEGENKRGNFSCLQLPFYCKNLKRIKNANQFISFLFSFLSASSVSVCFFFLQKDVFVIMIVYCCHIICNYGLSTAQIVIYSVRSSSEVSKQGGWGGGRGRRTSISLPAPPTTCRWRDTQLIRKFIPRIKKSVCTWHTELSLYLSVKF